MAIRMVALDFDGVVIPTPLATALSWKALLAELDVPSDLVDDAVHSQRGRAKADYSPIVNMVLDRHPKISAELLHQRRRQLRRQYISRLGPMPGAIELLRGLRNTDATISVVSNAPQAWIDGWWQEFGLPAVHSMHTPSAQMRPKPAPDLYLAAARSAGISVIDAIAIEDSTDGADAATSAGMRCAIFVDIREHRNPTNGRQLPQTISDLVDILNMVIQGD